MASGETDETVIYPTYATRCLTGTAAASALGGRDRRDRQAGRQLLNGYKDYLSFPVVPSEVVVTVMTRGVRVSE